MVGAVGIEKYPTLIKPCKQWCCSLSYRNNHYKHYKITVPLSLRATAALWRSARRSSRSREDKIPH